MTERNHEWLAERFEAESVKRSPRWTSGNNGKSSRLSCRLCAPAISTALLPCGIPTSFTSIPELGGGAPTEVHGAADWAKGAIAFAQAVSQAGQFVQLMLVDGNVGIVWAPGGKLISRTERSLTSISSPLKPVSTN
jgi:hypothetical protein